MGQAALHKLWGKAGWCHLQTQELCKSVFKGGRRETTREEFTRALAELINQLEKSKQS